MKKLHKPFLAFILSSVFLFSSCAAPNVNSNTNTNANQTVPSNKITENANQTKVTENNPSNITENNQGNTTENNSQNNSLEQIALNNSLSVNGNVFNISNAIYCNANNGTAIVVTGEWNGMEGILIFASVEEINSICSYSHNDFGEKMEIQSGFASKSTGEAYIGLTGQNITDESFSVISVGDNYMNVSISAAINTDLGNLEVKMSGNVTLSNAEIGMQLINDFNQIISEIQKSSSSGGKPFLCPSCHGDLKCRYCKGDGTCHDCLGYVDHCFSCLGSNVCRFCGRNGICKYCKGTGYIQ